MKRRHYKRNAIWHHLKRGEHLYLAFVVDDRTEYLLRPDGYYYSEDHWKTVKHHSYRRDIQRTNRGIMYRWLPKDTKPYWVEKKDMWKYFL